MVIFDLVADDPLIAEVVSYNDSVEHKHP